MNTIIRQSMNVQDWAMLLVLATLWGGSFFLIGIAVTELTPLTIVFVRLAIAALTLWAIVLLLRVPLPSTRQAWIALFTMGVLNNAIPFTLIVWGQTHIESGLASIFNAMTPLFTVLVAGIFLTDERFSTSRIVGVLLGLSGAIVIVGPDALSGLSNDVWAQLAVMGAALSYGFASVFGRRFKRLDVNPIAVAAGQVSMSAMLMLPVTLAFDKPFSQPFPSVTVVVAMSVLAVFCTAIAYILFFKLLASAGATNVSLVTFLVPVSAIVLGYIFLEERLQVSHFAGMFLIALGLSAIDGRLWRRRVSSS